MGHVLSRERQDEGTGLRLTVDHDRCCGAAQCVLAAPDLFDQGEDGLVMLLEPAPPAAARPRAEEAADACPSRAIKLHAEWNTAD